MPKSANKMPDSFYILIERIESKRYFTLLYFGNIFRSQRVFFALWMNFSSFDQQALSPFHQTKNPHALSGRHTG
jgi:hypothetical protein